MKAPVMQKKSAMLTKKVEKEIKGKKVEASTKKAVGKTPLKMSCGSPAKMNYGSPAKMKSVKSPAKMKKC